MSNQAKWVPDMVPGVSQLDTGTITDLIIWLDQEGIPPEERPTLWRKAGISPLQVEEAEEEAYRRYDSATFRAVVGKQRHGKRW